MEFNEKQTFEIAEEIVFDVFKTEHRSIEKIAFGICNEVFAVELPDRTVILRMNNNPEFRGSVQNIALLKDKGILVPEVIASDYSQTKFPFSYEILTRLPGRDLHFEIDKLNEAELRDMGKKIAEIFKKLAEIPTDGSFGDENGTGHASYKSWPDHLNSLLERNLKWGKESGVFDFKNLEKIKKLMEDYGDYFSSRKSIAYYDDIAGKNVLVDNGKFSGLVDLDSLVFGDPLEALGRIKTSWFNEKHGEIYLNAIMEELGFDDEQKKMVAVYACFWAFLWCLENGVQFNSNTEAKVDQELLVSNQKRFEDLYHQIAYYSENFIKM